MPDAPNAANVFANIANAYLFLGDYDKAETLGERAVKIFDRTPPKNKHEQANAHSVLGNALMWTNRLEGAKKHFLTAVAILQDLAPEGSVELARAYWDLGQLYLTAEDSSPGATYLLKALAIQEKLLPKNHLDNVTVCKLLTKIYRKTGKPEQAGKYSAIAEELMQAILERELKETLATALDAIELRADKMPADEFIAHCRSAVSCYRQLGDLTRAQKFLSAALKKIDATTSRKESSAAYFESSKLHEAQKNFDAAVADFKKALAIEQDSEPENFARLSTMFEDFGNLCFRAQKFEDALTHFERAVKFQLQCAYPNQDTVKLVKKSIGLTLKALNRTDEARIVFQTLLREWRNILPNFHPIITELTELSNSIPAK